MFAKMANQELTACHFGKAMIRKSSPVWTETSGSTRSKLEAPPATTMGLWPHVIERRLHHDNDAMAIYSILRQATTHRGSLLIVEAAGQQEPELT